MKNGRVIKGQVQGTGNYVSHYIGAIYTHVTFVHDDGKVEQLPNVTVPMLIGDFFCNGLNGQFYIHNHGKRNTILAIKTGNRSIFSIDDAKRIWRSNIQVHYALVIAAAFFGYISYLNASDISPSRDFLVITLVGFFSMSLAAYKTRIGARYLRPKKAEEFVRALGF